ncbi:MAG: hypothetical protein ACPGQL_02310 [Thermoplasmatota archaeon]
MKTLLTLATTLLLTLAGTAMAHDGVAVHGQCYQADGSGGSTALTTDDPTTFNAEEAAAAVLAAATGAPAYVDGSSADLCAGEPHDEHHPDYDGIGVEGNIAGNKVLVCYDKDGVHYDEASGNAGCRDPRHEHH